MSVLLHLPGNIKSSWTRPASLNEPEWIFSSAAGSITLGDGIGRHHASLCYPPRSEEARAAGSLIMARVLASFGKLLVLMLVLVHYSSSLPALERVQRHADGLYTSQLSKMRNEMAVRSFLNSVLISKRSIPEANFQGVSEEKAPQFEQVCFNWLYQNFLSNSLSENDAMDATEGSYKSLCPAISQLIANVKEYVSFQKYLSNI